MQDRTEVVTSSLRPNRKTLFALSVTLLFLIYAGFTSFHHEMWRDEMGPWLIARDSQTLLDIFHNIRYDGHPALWYILIWPLTRITTNPESILLLNLAVSGGTVFLITKAAPAPWWIRLVAVLGYYPVYEYGTIARNYSLGLLALFAFCAVFPFRRDHPFVLGTLLLLLANTSMLACLLAIAALIMLTIETATHQPVPGRKNIWRGLTIAAVGILFSVYNMIPPPDTGYAMGWHFGFDPAKLAQVMKNMTAAYLPLPKPGPGFWESELLAVFPIYREFSWIGAPLILILVSLALLRRPLALLYYLTGSLGLLAFFYVKHMGYLRHHGFLFICFGTALWLAETMSPVSLPGSLNPMSRYAERAVAVLLPIILVIHMAGAAIAATGEYKYTFSAAKATAELIRERGLDKLPLLADLDVTGMPVVGYLDKPSAYYPCGDRFGSYVIWDTARMLHSVVWDRILPLATRSASPVVVVVDEFVMRKFPLPGEWQPKLRLIGCRNADVVNDESYCAYLFDPAGQANK
ncbi:hypothetical protein [Geobacter sp. AOG2]|uniref:hypothetical protein n=1 Tax=Geobacter sp. AOG2 TaxID=1566347 RepID=UPI001CC5FCDC|nr:hypothetical protein [Geobacter sp. AOG2]